MKLFDGICTALVTPFYEGEIDVESLTKLIETNLENGIVAISVCGTTGESPTLSAKEKRKITRIAKSLCSGAVPVVRGIGSNDTRTAVEEAICAKKAGADILLALTPYYNKCTSDGLIAHFGAIAEATDLPIILYNVPSRTGVDIPIEVAKELCERYENVSGIKEASGSIQRIQELIRIDGLSVYGGDDALTLPTVFSGGRGVISVTSNVAPLAMCDLYKAVRDGDRERSIAIQNRLLPLFKAMFAEVNPIPIKFACAYSGLIASYEMRLPLTPCTEREVVMSALNEFGFTENGGAL